MMHPLSQSAFKSKIERLIGPVACVGGLILTLWAVQPFKGQFRALQSSRSEATRTQSPDDLGALLAQRGYVSVPLVLRQSDAFDVQLRILDVRLRINDEDFTFFIDTGASGTIMDRAAADGLRLRRELSGGQLVGTGGTTQELEKVALEKVGLGPVELPFAAHLGNMSVMNLTQRERGLAPHDGYLGMDLLMPHGAVVDCQSPRIFLRIPPPAPAGQHDSPSAKPSPDHVEFLRRQGYIAVPLHLLKSGQGVVEAEANGEPQRFLVDTGAMVCTLSEAVTQRLKLPAGGAPPMIIRGGDGAAGETAHNYVIEKLVVGGILVHLGLYSKDLKEIDAVIAAQGDIPYAGILGSDFLLTFSSVIDYSSGQLFLKVPDSH